MALSTGTSQGKRLSSEGLTVEALPVLSGSFIAGCVTAGFFFVPRYSPRVLANHHNRAVSPRVFAER